MAMGWWKPYFFLDPTGVQFLLPGLVIDGSLETLLVSGLSILVLSILDRYAAHASRNHHSNIHRSVFYYTVQKFTSGLLMLIMMSFNALLFLEVVLFGGAAELWMKLQTQNNRQENRVEYQGISEIEMEDC